jgi:hypothetical protein
MAGVHAARQGLTDEATTAAAARADVAMSGLSLGIGAVFVHAVARRRMGVGTVASWAGHSLAW